MATTTRHNTATRIIRVVEDTIEKKTKSGANIEYTYGQVFGITGSEASVYLAGSRELAASDGGVPEPSTGYRLPPSAIVNSGDYVRVAMDSRGTSRIAEVLPTTDFGRIAFDVNSGAIFIGSGVAMPARRVGGSFYVEAYGAKGDGVTDDTTAIQAAIDDCFTKGGGTVHFAAATYITSAVVSIKTGVYLKGAGIGLTVIKQTTTASVFNGFNVGVATSNALAANANKNTNTVTVGSGIGVQYAAGDYVAILSEAQAQNAAGTKKGDIYRVQSVAGDVVTIEGSLLDTYLTTNTAAIRKLTVVKNAGVSDMTLKNNMYTTATTTATNPLLYVQLFVGCAFTNLEITENNGHGVSFLNAFECRLNNSKISYLRDDIANGIYGYGVAISSICRQIVINGNTIHRVRHGVTSTTANSGVLPNYGAPKSISIVANSITDTWHAGIDTHEDGEAWAIVGNTISGSDYIGIQVRNWRATVTGNAIFGIRGYGIYIDSSSFGTTVSSNTVTRIGQTPAAGGGHGIYVDALSTKVIGNYVTECYGHGIAVAANATVDINITGNSSLNNGQGAATTYDGININAAITRLLIVGNSCLDTQTSKTQRYGLRLESTVVNSDGRITIMSNDLSNNATGPYSNAGTATFHMWGNSPQNAPGHQQRLRALTTGSIAANATVDITLTWPYTFSDTNYVAFVNLLEASANLEIKAIKSKTSTTIVVTVKNNDAANARTGAIDALAIHD